MTTTYTSMFQKDLDELDQLQALAYRLITRRALLAAVTQQAIASADHLRLWAADALLHAHVRQLVHDEESFTKAGTSRFREILRHTIPIGAVEAPARHTALPPASQPNTYSGLVGDGAPVIDEEGALTRSLDNVASMMQHLLQRTGDDGGELAEFEDVYARTAGYQGRRL